MVFHSCCCITCETNGKFSLASDFWINVSEMVIAGKCLDAKDWNNIKQTDGCWGRWTSTRVFAWVSKALCSVVDDGSQTCLTSLLLQSSHDHGTKFRLNQALVQHIQFCLRVRSNLNSLIHHPPFPNASVHGQRCIFQDHAYFSVAGTRNPNFLSICECWAPCPLLPLVLGFLNSTSDIKFIRNQKHNILCKNTLRYILLIRSPLVGAMHIVSG